MRKLTYYTRAEISLHLEDYHNAGLTTEETRAAIESLPNPGSNISVTIRQSGINSNWIVTISSIDRGGSIDRGNIGYFVWLLEQKLEALLAARKNINE